jgi:LytS/YehU family sensor histidine kinase
MLVYFLLDNILLPKFFPGKKWMGLSASLLLLLVITLYVQPFDKLVHFSGFGRERNDLKKEISFPVNNNDRPGPPPGEKNDKKPGGPMFDIVSVFLLLMTLLLTIAEAAIKQSRFTEQRALQAEADKANAELSFLKAQINPHFLFNTLNKSDKAPDAVMKLSNIMRYITDGANETLVPLQDETDCINDYISLQKLRLGDNFPVAFSVEGNMTGKQLPPLVLMTFVENTFKHGISNHEENSVAFKIVIQDKHLHFFAQNKLFAVPRNTERTGIGIDNTKKRLQVLYPDKHLLNIEQEKGFYTVNLILYS